MRIIAKNPKLKNFSEKHPESKLPIDTWYNFVKKAKWKNGDDIKRHYSNASILKSNRAVFRIGGNKYRIVVKIEYTLKIVYIRFVGTHDEYNKINAEEI